VYQQAEQELNVGNEFIAAATVVLLVSQLADSVTALSLVSSGIYFFSMSGL
jgi:hypothetical protein